MILQILAYAIVGVLSGILSGLLGISGGLVTVPCLLFLFGFFGFAPEHLMQLAVGTSLASMTFNTAISTIGHSRHQCILWNVVKAMIPGLLCGCILGSLLGSLIPTTLLQMIFGVFIILVGIYFYWSKQVEAGESRLPSAIFLSGIGFSVGLIANFLGIGGGIFVVPVLAFYRLSMRNAIGTSSAIAFIITFLGALSYLFLGLGEPFYNKTLGYIYLPAFATISLTSVSALYGVKLTHTISPKSLKKLVAMVLAIAGIVMLLKS